MFIQTKQTRQNSFRQIMGVVLVVAGMSFVALDRSMDLGLTSPGLANAQDSAPSNAQENSGTNAGG